MTGRGASVRAEWVGLGLAFLALAVIGAGGLMSAWDGGWFVVRTAETGTPTFLHGRVFGWVAQAPAILVRTFVTDPRIVAPVMGLTFAAFQAIAMLASWRVVRPDRPELLAFPVLGIGLGLMAGQALMLSEGIVAVALAWPLVLAAVLGRLGRHRIMAAALVVAIAAAHPFAIPIFGIVAVVALVRAWRSDGGARRSNVTAAGVFAMLAGLVVLRYAIFATPYEVDTLSLDRLLSQFRGSVAGRPLVAIGGAIALAGWLVVRPRMDRVGAIVAVLGVTVITAVMVVWAADVERWQRGLMFRTFVLFVQMPIYGLAVIAALRSPASNDGRPLSRLVIPAVGLAMLAVYSVQTVAWRSSVDGLLAALRDVPAGCVEAHPTLTAAIRETPLDHWGLTSLVIAAEYPAPSHLVVDTVACSDLDGAGGIPIKVVEGTVQDRVPVEGWFDLSRIAEAAGWSTAP